MSATEETPGGAQPPEAVGESAYQQVQRSPEFAALRKKWRGFIFTLSAIFLAWFMLYVILADFAKGFMNTTIGDSNITIGLIFGLLQFVSTFVIATAYVQFAGKNLDPEAARLRRKVEENL